LTEANAKLERIRALPGTITAAQDNVQLSTNPEAAAKVLYAQPEAEHKTLSNIEPDSRNDYDASLAAYNKTNNTFLAEKNFLHDLEEKLKERDAIIELATTHKTTAGKFFDVSRIGKLEDSCTAIRNNMKSYDFASSTKAAQWEDFGQNSTEWGILEISPSIGRKLYDWAWRVGIEKVSTDFADKHEELKKRHALCESIFETCCAIFSGAFTKVKRPQCANAPTPFLAEGAELDWTYAVDLMSPENIDSTRGLEPEESKFEDIMRTDASDLGDDHRNDLLLENADG
jgi:hypothetical protein